MSEEKNENEITFKIESKHRVKIMRNKKQIGHIFSEGSYSGKNTIQMCGFDMVTGVWSCGPFKGKKDLCVRFLPEEKECPSHTMVPIGEAHDGYGNVKTVKKCWTCDRMELD